MSRQAGKYEKMLREFIALCHSKSIKSAGILMPHGMVVFIPNKQLRGDPKHFTELLWDYYSTEFVPNPRQSLRLRRNGGD